MRFILSLAILFTVVASHANLGLSCVDIFSKQSPSADVLKLLNENKPQEAAWLLEEQGFTKEANKLIEDIIANLDLANSMQYTPTAWRNRLGSKGSNLHTSYLIDVGRVKGVLKFGDFNFVTEALAFEIGKILNLRVPVSRSVVIGGHKASIQYYVADRPTVKKAIGELDIYSQVEVFDVLIMNPDRNGSNLLVDHALIKGTPRSVYEEADKIFIDNERAFSFNPNLWTPKQSDIVNFIKNQLPYLKKEDPEFAKILSLPKTESQIIALINASQLPTKDRAINHVQLFLGAYQSIYRAN